MVRETTEVFAMTNDDFDVENPKRDDGPIPGDPQGRTWADLDDALKAHGGSLESCANLSSAMEQLGFRSPATVVDLEHRAWHEAGHALVSCCLGEYPLGINILATGVIDDMNFAAVTRMRRTRGALYELIPMLSAGYLAERIVNPDRATARWAARRDTQIVERLDPYRYPDEPGAPWRRETFQSPTAWYRFLLGQRRVAGRLLKRHRRQLQELADALLAGNGEMCAEEVRAFAMETGLGPTVIANTDATASPTPQRPAP